jgi:hypothetical protein
MLQNILNSTETIALTYNTASAAVETGFGKGFGVSLDITNVAPSAGAFTAAVNDICTKSTHGFLTGLKVQLTTTGVLPAGLSLITDYFVIKIDADTFKLASSLVNAQAGTAVDITDTGTGTHTITPTALAGANYKMQGSFDNSSWFDIGSAVNITASATALVEKVDPMFSFVRMYFTLTAGQLSIAMNTVVRG